MNLNFDELQGEWAARDRALDDRLQLNTALLRQMLINQHRQSMRLGFFDWYELIVGGPLLVFLIWFVGGHLQAPEFLLPGAALLAWTIALPLMSWRQRRDLRALDYELPVLQRQQRFETLRLNRLQLFKWAFLLGQLLWFIPFLIVFLKGVFGVNLYLVSKNFIGPSLIGGVLFIPLAIGLAKLLPERVWQGPRMRAFGDMLAGRDIAETRGLLEQLRRFEQEGG